MATAFTQLEKVYLSRVVVAFPIANIPTEAIGATLLLAALKADGPYALLALTVNV